MPEPKTRRVLLCGGPLDGRWVDVPKDQYSYRAPEPMQLSVVLDSAPVALPLPEFVTYQLEPMPIRIRNAGGELWIGATGYGYERDEAIVRALFQRDVARQLLGAG